MKAFKLIFILLITSVSAFCQNYNDNLSQLDDERINPIFAKTVKKFLDSAKKAGFRPVIKQAYRSFSEAEDISNRGREEGFPAASVSVHTFGLAVDIWLANEKGEIFSFDPKEYSKHKENRFSYNKWMKFIRIGESFGLINAYMHDDTDHWELHPDWDKKDWVSAKKVIMPIYEKHKGIAEIDKLKIIWKDAGL